MAESEVKIRVRLELDEGDKSAIRSQAKAIKDTGVSPVQSSQGESFRGGIFGDTEDTGVKGFEKRQSISGGVNRLRDRTSAQPFQKISSFSQLQEKIDGLENTISNPELMQKALGINIKDFNSVSGFFKNPVGAVGSVAKFVPFISALLLAPEFIDAFINLMLKPGGPFDKRLKIILENQEQQFLSREAQKRRELGLDQVVISQGGFGNANGRLTVNTLQQVKSTGTSDIGLNEVSIGLR